jgi:carboxyl-terminal processing protease
LRQIRTWAVIFAGALAVIALELFGFGHIAAAARYDDLNLFSSVLEHVRRFYVEPVDDNQLVRGAVRGLLAELDPHSSFMDREAYKEMQVDTRGEFHGLGIEISKRPDGFIEVIAPIDGTPAARAGIRPRDQIVGICPDERPEDWEEDCRATKNMNIVDAVKLMRGPRGSTITLQIFRKSFDAPQPYTVKRDIVKVESVASRMLEPGYAYVALRAFQENTASDLASGLEKLHKVSGKAFDGVVLDLRNNPGGLLDQAVKVADLFLTEGLVVYTKGRVESQLQEFRASAEGDEPTYPIAILINEGSASASEIVAGALQDHHRALVIGQKSFGKGSVQTVFPLEGGAGLRLTTALYYTPAGRSIQEVGIEPDIAVQNPSEGDRPAAEQRVPRRLREKDLEGHFTQEDAAKDKKSKALPEASEEEPSPAAEPGAEAPADLQLARAVEVLKSWTYFDRLRDVPKLSEQAKAN